MSETLNPGNAPEERPAVRQVPFDGIEDEINLLDLLLLVARNKRMILKATLGAAVLVAVISLLFPNIYCAETMLAPVISDEESGSSLKGALGGMAAMAGMAGVSLPGGGSVEENLAVLRSREFLWKFAEEKKLLPILFESEWDAAHKKWEEDDPAEQPGPYDLYRMFIEDGMLTVEKDEDTGLVRVALEWEDAALATRWTNDLVAAVNAYLAQQAIARSRSNLQYLNEELMRTPVEEMRKTLFNLIASEQKNAMLASAQKDYAFRVLDPAAVPDEKIKPMRALIVIFAAMVVFFLAVIWAFIREALSRAEEDPEQAERVRELRRLLRWKD